MLFGSESAALIGTLREGSRRVEGILGVDGDDLGGRLCTGLKGFALHAIDGMNGISEYIGNARDRGRDIIIKF